MDATIERTGLTTVKITAGATHNITVTIYKMNTSYGWDEVSGSPLTILATANETFTYSSDGVYKFVVTENSIDTSISDVQYDDYMDCMKEKTKTIIDCGCSNECDDDDLYGYTSAFLLGITYFGDYTYSLKDITSPSATETSDLQDIYNAIVRTTKYITNCT